MDTIAAATVSRDFGCARQEDVDDKDNKMWMCLVFLLPSLPSRQRQCVYPQGGDSSVHAQDLMEMLR